MRTPHEEAQEIADYSGEALERRHHLEQAAERIIAARDAEHAALLESVRGEVEQLRKYRAKLEKTQPYHVWEMRGVPEQAIKEILAIQEDRESVRGERDELRGELTTARTLLERWLLTAWHEEYQLVNDSRTFLASHPTP
jgi:chromosome segregation ATPase